MTKKVRIKIFIFGFLFIVSVTPVFINKTVNGSNKTKNEFFRPELARFDNTEKLTHGIDSIYKIKQISNVFDTALYVQTASDFVKNRFYHGLANYSITDNWIAYSAGKIFWPHFSAIVKPDDLLKHSEGLCSQQTIVFLHILRIKGIPFRTVGLGYKEGPGHFLCEVSYNGSWHLHDVTIEPKWEKVVNHHKSLSYYLQNKDSLLLAYEGRIDEIVFNRIMSRVEYGEVNVLPAKRMSLFHRVTFALTYILPCVFLVLFFISWKRRYEYK